MFALSWVKLSSDVLIDSSNEVNSLSDEGKDSLSWEGSYSDFLKRSISVRERAFSTVDKYSNDSCGCSL